MLQTGGSLLAPKKAIHLRATFWVNALDEKKRIGTQPGDGRNHAVYIGDKSGEKIVLLPRVVFLCAFSSLEKWK